MEVPCADATVDAGFWIAQRDYSTQSIERTLSHVAGPPDLALSRLQLDRSACSEAPVLILEVGGFGALATPRPISTTGSAHRLQDTVEIPHVHESGEHEANVATLESRFEGDG